LNCAKRQGQQSGDFGMSDFREIIEALEQHPEWRAELRRLILTEELLTVPATVSQLVQSQQHTDEQIRQLTQAQRQTTEQIQQLTEQAGSGHFDRAGAQ
jgi:ATP phosphoribosyltransferase regulatory subunit HisZ